jgi:carboxypeptidase Taq
MSDSLYNSFVEKQQKIANIGASIGLLQWDSEVNLPTNSAGQRSRQIATLYGIMHEEVTEKSYYKLLKTLSEESLNPTQKKNVSLALRSNEKDRKFKKDFVIKKSMIVSEAFDTWSKAKSANDFKSMNPLLIKLSIFQETKPRFLDLISINIMRCWIYMSEI